MATKLEDIAEKIEELHVEQVKQSTLFGAFKDDVTSQLNKHFKILLILLAAVFGGQGALKVIEAFAGGTPAVAQVTALITGQ